MSTAAATAGRPVPPGFVALDDEQAVHPAEVRVIVADRTGTRVYLRGAGRPYLDVAKPIHEVMRLLAHLP